MKRRREEEVLQANIEIALGAEPDLLILRNAVGVAEYTNKSDGRVRKFHYGLGKGSPDLVGILRRELRHRGPGWPVIEHYDTDGVMRCFAHTVPAVVGTWFCLELKSEDGRLSDDQKRVIAAWRSFGAFVACPRTVEEARAALERARRGEPQ